LFCLVWFFYSGFIAQRVFVALYPQLGWYFAYRVECVSMPLSTLFLMLAVDAMFPGLVHKPVRMAAAISCGVLTVCCLLVDTLPLSYAQPYYSYLFFAVEVYLAGRFLWRFRKDRDPEGIVVFAGLCVYGYATVRDMFYHNNIVFFPMVYADFLDFAILVFILFAMVAGFYGAMRQAEAVKEREMLLAAKNADLEAHNLRLLERNERTQELLRRVEASPERFLTHGPLTLDIVSGQAFMDGKGMGLAQKDFKLFLLFAQNEDKIMSAEYIYENAWGQPIAGNRNAVWMAISRLRKEVKPAGYDIRTIRGKGYVFEKT
jgi:biotin operon repressor